MTFQCDRSSDGPEKSSKKIARSAACRGTASNTANNPVHSDSFKRPDTRTLSGETVVSVGASAARGGWHLRCQPPAVPGTYGGSLRRGSSARSVDTGPPCRDHHESSTTT